MQRIEYHVDFEYAPTAGEVYEGEEDDSNGRWPAVGGDGNTFSSHVQGRPGLHAPVIDIDYPARLVPSSTPGHFHLYLDEAIPWSDYVRVLEVLADVGLIERGYANASIRRGASFVRKPGVSK